KKFEIFAEGTSNPWGLDWRNTDGQFIEACCVIPHLFHMVPGGVYKRQAGQNFNPYAYGQINEICDHTFHRESGWAHAGLISLDVPHMPEKYRNSVIFGSIHGCSLKRNTLKPNGSTFTASRADDFLVSGDKNVRPINLRWGPNGDIYLIDWHDQNPCHQTKPDDWDYERGRVYRIQLKGTQPKKAEDLGKKTEEELAEMSHEADPYRFRTALRLLADRPVEKTAVAIQVPYQADPTLPLRLRTIWTMASMSDRLTTQWTPKRSSKEEQPTASDILRLEWLCRSLKSSTLVSPEVLENIASGRMAAAAPTVRRELASTALRLADSHDVRRLLHALMQRQEDANDPLIPFLTWLAYEKVLSKPAGRTSRVNAELAWLAEQSPKNLLVRDQIVPRVMRRLVATGQPYDLEKCLKFVADVTDTHTREKALDGLAEALKGRSVTPPPAWKATREAVAKAGSPKLDDLLNRLAVSFRDPAAVKRAIAVLNAPDAPDDRRIEAVRELAELRADDAVPLFRTLAGKTDAPVSLRVEAVRALAGFARKDTPVAVLAGWKTYPPAVKSEAVTLLAGRKDWAAALLLAMQAGTVERAAVSDNAIVRIESFEDAKLNDLITKAWGRSRPTPKELTAQIDKARESLAAPGASFARGKLVFDNQCAKCHKFDGRGNDVGPPLDGAGRDIEYLLANVIDPNRVIGSPYFQRIVKTEDGRVEQGLLAAEDDKSITLKVENGVLKRFEKADLDGPVKVVEKSMMPEGLTAGMSAQDFRDLVRYVMAHPFLTEVTVNGKPATAGVGGYVQLPDFKETGTATVDAEFTAVSPLKTSLLVGSRDPFEVLLDGKPVGTGKGGGFQVAVDAEAVPVDVPAGKHVVTVRTKYAGDLRGVFVRFLDPDRALSYPDAAGK
ncbi:MAG: DUF7133 domain-containing protein, partial [Fimbriiglobus sp.]